MRDNSKCQKAIFCDFHVVLDDTLAQVEVCRYCSKKVIYNKYDGRIDNEQYRRDHIRHFVQPGGRTGKLFEQIYKTDVLRYQHLKQRKNKVDEYEDWARATREAKIDLKSSTII